MKQVDIEKLHEIELTPEEKRLYREYFLLHPWTEEHINMGCLNERYTGGGVREVVLTYTPYAINVSLRIRELGTDNITEVREDINIPYRNVAAVSSDKKTISWVQPATVEHRNGSAVKGAIAGGIIAGAPGAVAGAAISASTRKEVVRLASAHSADHHYFKVDFINGVRLEVDDLTNSSFPGDKCDTFVQEISAYTSNPFDIRTNKGLAEAKRMLEKNKEGPKKEETNKTNGCYVATAVYGSYNCPEVWALRRYRDYTLAKTWYGRAFIRTYYAISPTLVKWLGNTAWFKKMLKGRLDCMVNNLQNKGYETTPYEDRNW